MIEDELCLYVKILYQEYCQQLIEIIASHMFIHTEIIEHE